MESIVQVCGMQLSSMVSRILEEEHISTLVKYLGEDRREGLLHFYSLISLQSHDKLGSLDGELDQSIIVCDGKSNLVMLLVNRVHCQVFANLKELTLTLEELKGVQ